MNALLASYPACRICGEPCTSFSSASRDDDDLCDECAARREQRRELLAWLDNLSGRYSRTARDRYRELRASGLDILTSLIQTEREYLTRI